MPQLNKVRIVNFTYNNGKRIIPDTCFSFQDNGGKPLNTLISLANGGGKSVLVQLLLQPILPKTRLAKRKIESFFEKSSDHCFVLLEWRLDNSTQRLLTGIALSAGENLAPEGEEGDSRRGMTVKYYTFLKEYGAYGDPYDIERLELSQKQGQRFVPQPFEYVRELAKKKNGNIKYFSSEQQSEYQEALGSYGISEAEWKNTIRRVNETEGGMVAYFETFATGNMLVDRLLIPGIEETFQDAQISGEDDSLRTMMLNYVREYKEKEQETQLRGTALSLKKELEQQQPKISMLFELNDDCQKADACLSGFGAALKINRTALENKLAELCRLKDETEKQRQHLELEQASAAYYSAKAAFEDAQEQVVQHTQSVIEHEQKIADLEHIEKCLKSAYEAERIKDYKTKVQALDIQISAMLGQADIRQRINQLRYSVAQKASVLCEETEKEQKKLEERHKEAFEESRICVDEKAKAEQCVQKTNAECSRIEGALEAQKKHVEETANSLQLNLIWKIDKDAEDTELNLLRTRLCKSENSIDERIKQLKESICAMQQKSREAQERQENAKDERRKKQTEIESAQEKLEKYLEEEAALKTVFERRSIDFSARFSSGPMHELTQIREESAAELRAQEQRCTALQAQIDASEQGYLHIPKAVTDYLTANGVQFISCERYLRDCPLTAQQVCELLKKYPECAYGIILEDTDFIHLQNDARANWLPAMIPVYSYDDLDKMLSNTFVLNQKALAFYAQEAFAETERYLTHLRMAQRENKEKAAAMIGQQHQLEEDIRQIDKFEYSAEWEKEHREYLNRIETGLEELEDRLLELKKQQEKCDEDAGQAMRQAELEENEKRQIERRLEIIAVLEKQLSAYRDNLKALWQAQEAQRICVKKYKAAQASAQAAQEKLRSIETDIDEIALKKQKYQAYSDETANAENAEILDGDADALYKEWKTLSGKCDSEIGALTEQREEKLEEINQRRKELERIGLAENEYEGISFSDARLDSVKQSLDTEQNKRREAQREYEIALKTEAGRQESFENAGRSVYIYAEAPLAQEEIHGDFLSRKKELAKQTRDCEENERNSNQRLAVVNSILHGYERELKEDLCDKAAIELDEDVAKQFNRLRDESDRANAVYKKEETLFIKELRRIESAYQEQQEFKMILTNAIALLENAQDIGDRYFSLSEQFLAHLQNLDKLIAQIEISLRNLDADRDDLVRQCVRQGERVYTHLKLLMESSRVKIQGKTVPTAMLKLNLPEEVDKAAAQVRIQGEIHQGAEELLALIKTDTDQSQVMRRTEKLVGSRNLLNRYIGQDNIAVQVYKIDLNKGNSCYRTWEDTLVKNSGGERFVVYFALLVTLMNYSRSGGMSDTRKKNSGSVLLLDNPFGPITSAHLLDPMFDIARCFHVQLVCLSDINKCDITQCFESVIKVVVKPMALSNMEVLSAENSEMIEHGFYQAEQLSLL